MQKQKTKSRKKEEAAQTEAKARESDIDSAALDKLLDEIDAGIKEDEDVRAEIERLAFLEKLRSIQTPRRSSGCDHGALAGDYEYVMSVY
jgi:hypothetical protein